MPSIIMGMLAETFVHPGTGQTTGAIDLPVARERVSDFPYVAGSSVKGALRDLITRRATDADADRLFGRQDNAGEVIPSDLRILLLPVRSLSASYYWITCPVVLERLARDLRRTGQAVPAGLEATLPAGTGIKGPEALKKHNVVLEERVFPVDDGLPDGLTDAVGRLVPHETTRRRLATQLLVVPDDIFTWFCRYGLAVQARNQLNAETKRSENLWYEETLCPDTLMYGLLTARRDQVDADKAWACMEETPYMQLGGNETVGQGVFALCRMRQEGGGQ